MKKINTFQDLKVWQKAHELVLSIYQITREFPNDEKFGLVNQMRRAATSIAFNIVEGFERQSSKDSLHFYNISDGSLEELKYQLILAKDLKYINQSTYKVTLLLAEEVSKMLNSWIKSQLDQLK